ncbi:MAG: hydantoinase B/oxoprolinase family protein [Ardenticatenaceae bacterium]|nr:hydantoinase B/oxoprolinase family protein [Ardenticatenaceae bacterium]HBY93161.1 hydantoin utilization protein B [Chloroflexota bacterium]
MALQPAEIAVIRSQLEQIADEMDSVLVRTAFSPIISEANDRAHGIFDSDGNTIVQGAGGMPIFIGSMEFAVKTLKNRGAVAGTTYVLNDPYLVGTHLQDVKLIRLLADEAGQPMLYLGSTAHWMDLGGTTPGGWTPDAKDIYQEGIRLPPLPVASEGQILPHTLELLRANTRVPDDIEGDLRAQLAALDVGEQRLRDLIRRVGRQRILDIVAEINLRSQKLMESILEELAPGVYTARDYLDNDGVTDAELEIRATLTVGGGRIEFDFAGSSPPCVGPLNLALPTTVSACYAAIKHAFPSVPINAGAFKQVAIHAPDTTFVNAPPPRPVGGYTEAAQRVIDVVLEVLRQAGAAHLGAGNFSTSSAITLSGRAESGRFYVALFNISGGYGGTLEHDGLCGANPPMGHAQMVPIEVYETRFPVLFEWYRLREGSAGAGKHRGGLGTEYGFRLDAQQAYLSLMGDRSKHPPHGVECGYPSPTGTEFLVVRDGVEHRPPLRTKVSRWELRRGDLIVLKSPGGGGFGDPRQRASEAVARDLCLGYVDERQAREIYGSGPAGSDTER